MTGPRLTRRAFVTSGGALVVSLSLPPSLLVLARGDAEAAENSLDATKLAS